MTPRYNNRRLYNSPLGKAIAGLLENRLSVHEVMRALFGADSRIGRRIFRMLQRGSLVTGKLDLEKVRDLRRRSARRMLAVCLMLIERMRMRENGRIEACGRVMWLGHMARRARLTISKGGCCREIGRYVRLLAECAAIARVQPPASKVPEHLKSLRNQWSAYNIYRVEGLPKPIMVRLWEHRNRKRHSPLATPTRTVDVTSTQAKANIARALELIPGLARLL